MIKPVGFQILLVPRKMEDKSKGGVFLPDMTKDAEEVGAVVCQVVDMGPEAYHGDRFPEGPWCKTGDWVVIGKYAGNRFKFEGQEYRLMNDDKILATVDDPNKVTRA